MNTDNTKRRAQDAWTASGTGRLRSAGALAGLMTMGIDVTRVRFIVEGERAFDMGGRATFTPSAEVGLRHDGGDSETGTGLEVGAGVRYTAGAITIKGQVRTLIAHEDNGGREKKPLDVDTQEICPVARQGHQPPSPRAISRCRSG